MWGGGRESLLSQLKDQEREEPPKISNSSQHHRKYCGPTSTMQQANFHSYQAVTRCLKPWRVVVREDRQQEL